MHLLSVVVLGHGNNNMPKYIIAIAVTFLLISGCATTGMQGLSDKEYAELLVGTWTNRINKSKKYNYFEKTYYGDGTATGYFTEGHWTNYGLYVEEDGYRFQSKWKILDGVVIIWDIETEPPGIFKKGTVIRDKIIYLGDKEAEYADVDDGHTFMRYRK
jgi:hypothetical protein